MDVSECDWRTQVDVTERHDRKKIEIKTQNLSK